MNLRPPRPERGAPRDSEVDTKNRATLLAVEALGRISPSPLAPLFSAIDLLMRAAGRRGAAGVEELMAFGQEEQWQRELLEAASECAAEVERDYASFEAAWRKRDPRLTALIGAR